MGFQRDRPARSRPHHFGGTPTVVEPCSEGPASLVRTYVLERMCSQPCSTDDRDRPGVAQPSKPKTSPRRRSQPDQIHPAEPPTTKASTSSRHPTRRRVNRRPSQGAAETTNRLTASPPW